MIAVTEEMITSFAKCFAGLCHRQLAPIDPAMLAAVTSIVVSNAVSNSLAAVPDDVKFEDSFD